MTNSRLLKVITLSSLPSKKRKRLIAFVFLFGFLCLAFALVLHTFFITPTDTTILAIDKDITESQEIIEKLQLSQSMGLVPYNLTTLLELLPNAPPWIKSDLDYETQKMQLLTLELLCWPWDPTTQQRSSWAGLTFDQLEHKKLEMITSFTSKVQLLIDKRRDLIEAKQELLLYAIILQLVGLVCTGAGSTLRAISR